MYTHVHMPACMCACVFQPRTPVKEVDNSGVAPVGMGVLHLLQ